MIERWKVFYNKKTGEQYAAYTIQGEMAGEERGTIELEAAERGIDPTDIAVRVEEHFIN